MAVLVWCWSGHLPGGAGPVNLAGCGSPGNERPAHFAQCATGPRNGSTLEAEIGTNHIPTESGNHCRVRSNRSQGRAGARRAEYGKPQMNDDVRTGLEEQALDKLSDEELVVAHLHGRTGAFEDLYDRYRDRLVHFVTRKTGDGDQAQDLVQEAFIRVTRHLHRFDTSKKFSTWVYTIASNLSKNELRNRSRSPLVLFQRLTNSWDDDHRPIQFEDFRTRPDDLYRKRFLKRLVEDTVQELPEHHRLVFQLRELEGKSYEEISEITGVNLGTVKSRLHRARNSFAQRIEPFLN